MESWEGMGGVGRRSEAAVRTRLAGLAELGLVQERPIRMHGTGGQVHAAQRKEGRSCTVLSVDRGAQEPFAVFETAATDAKAPTYTGSTFFLSADAVRVSSEIVPPFFDSRRPAPAHCAA